jgi:signal transduction histidine kinase
MRFTIATKLFLGFLIIIFLNVFFVAIVSKLTDLNIIASILKRQNEIKNHLLHISNLHISQTRSRLIFEKLRKQESADNFLQTGRYVATLMDSTLMELTEVYRLDSIVNAENDSTDPGIRQLTVLFNEKVYQNNTTYMKNFEDLVSYGSQKTDWKSKQVNMTLEILELSDRGLREGLAMADSMIEYQTWFRIKDIENRVDGMRRLTLIIVTGISIFSLIFGLIFSKTMTNSLRKLRESARTIGKGEFNFNPKGYPRDEIGDLATAFFEMAYDLKRAQDELIKSKRLAAIGQIVASVNHEINNPLMIISGNAQFLEMSMEGYPDEMKGRVKAILEETERISQVTRKLREIKNPVVEDYTSSGEQMINLDKSSK